MMRPLFDIATLKDDIQAGALILTSNNRLATKIRQAWGLHQQEIGLNSWKQPHIHAIEHWIDECWQRCCDTGIPSALTGSLMPPQVEQILWEQAIDDDKKKPGDLLPANFINLASTTYNSVQRWMIPDARIKEEAPLFWRWICHFRAQLAEHQLITAADRTLALLKSFEQNQLQPVEHIVLIGFDSISPLYTALTNAAAKSVCHRGGEELATGSSTLQPQRLVFHDENLELETAAIWAASRQQAAPDCRVGIVIPELARLRPQVERIIRKQLEPEYFLPHKPRAAVPFNISAGIPLADTPMIGTALLLLMLNKQKLPLTVLCQLLNSPFWGSKQPTLRAVTEVNLRNLEKRTVKCSEFRYQVYLAEESMGDAATTSASGLAARLEAAETLRREMPSKTSFSQWLMLFQQQLNSLGWPGERPVDSIEHQQYQHWQRVQENYQLLDILGRQVSLHDALFQLQRLVSQTVFQAETTDASIQVLGLLESASLHFDHLWVMGMDDTQWPQPTALSPLLPAHIQKEYGTPKSSPDQELELARKQITSLKCAANEVIFSHSEFDINKQRQVSHLINDLPVLNISDVITTAPEQDSSPIRLEKVPCEYAPPLDLAKTMDKVKGGSGLFRDQAACPFNAFARHRLGALKPAEPQLGLSSRDRGSLLHECLERLWHQLGCHQELINKSSDELTEIITEAVDSALRYWTKKYPALFSKQFTAIEQQRLVQLLEQWLEVEKNRPAFSVVAFESEIRSEFAGLPVKLIIDRIDQLNDGQQVIIDYKTGRSTPASWLGERPDQPQIPLYVLCSQTPVSAATFAIINASQQQFVGFANNSGVIPQVEPPGKKNEPENWDDLLAQWHQSLSNLADEYKCGYAPVIFYNTSAKQYQQELEPLNRRAELSGQAPTATPFESSSKGGQQ